MPGRPRLCSQPLSAAARGSPRRRRALTQPQSGCSAEQDLRARSRGGSTAALEPQASGPGGTDPFGSPSSRDSPGQSVLSSESWVQQRNPLISLSKPLPQQGCNNLIRCNSRSPAKRV
ncbi:hypothetical protein NN561_009004 [Cricetulus griseus]